MRMRPSSIISSKCKEYRYDLAYIRVLHDGETPPLKELFGFERVN
jgi:hypothetical protein